MKKRIFITGSTDGIGKLTAISLAKQDHEIIIHGRNAQKLSEVLDEFKSISGNEKITGFVGDLSSINAIRKMTSEIKNEVEYVDVLINNAGIFNSSESMSVDGIELRYAVNYLAPFLLTKELLPLIQGREDARIINLSSAAQDSISYNVMMGREKVEDGEAYAQSKLALTMWSFYFANLVKDITVIAVNPGSLLNTKMVKEAFGRSWSPVDKGADILCDLALNEKHVDHSGEYFDNDSGRYGIAHSDAYNGSELVKLYEFTNEILNY